MYLFIFSHDSLFSFFLDLDSVYTERYMKTPKLNPQGYEQSAVNNMTGFRNAKYLLAHGTGDDNGNR
jgi:dipeptidyl aminopeptidase/acylaminoacyl peptidase